MKRLPPFMMTGLVGGGLLLAALWPAAATNTTAGKKRAPSTPETAPEPAAQKESGTAITATAGAPPAEIKPPAAAPDATPPKKTASRTPPPRKSVSMDLGPMLFFLQRELRLTAEERKYFESVLTDREGAIGELQVEVVRSGVLCRGEYDRRVRALQAQYYERMGAGLDSRRYRRFAELVAEGGFGDAVAFEVPAGLEVRD